MAIQKGNIATQGISGHIGKERVYKQYKNGTVVTKYPDMSRVVRSGKQADENSLFARAVAFAKAINAGEDTISDQQFSVKEGQSLYHAALSWYIKQEKQAAVNKSR